MSYLLGQSVRLSFETYSDPALTVPADPTTVAVTVRKPDGTSSTYTWAAAQVVKDSTGKFHYDFVPATSGHYEAYWQAGGAVVTSFEESFDVRPAYSNIVSVDDVKARLNKSQLKHLDDDKIRDQIDAAIDAYREWVLNNAPITGQYSEVLDGGGTSLRLSVPTVASLVSLTYADGTVVNTTDVTLDTTTGQVFWNYGTAGRFAGGSRYVTVTYMVGALPAHHREAIVADVAGWFSATSRGPDPLAEEGLAASWNMNPLVSFPRIRALAGPAVA